ncbi:hypothetical protein SERLA73DRAFT_75579 [Serpula lacrymans var. lacrymans S7.3]|uniref:Uncharacterized protein n=2 Tax=Serpula lacrymans var. lacrymans TaxID=341189 RepID=F8Q580_SERL3|nr:hypothetical protein SERLA73DRAFT_75579 [Serpula lacrymans var. lacrymans S7.3]
MYNYILPKFTIIHKEQTRLCQIPTLGTVNANGIDWPLRVVSWKTSPGVNRELNVCKLDCIAWATRVYVLADAKFHKAEVKVQKKRSLKADTDVAMGEATASGSKFVESLIDRKVSTAFKKIQKLHNARVKERVIIKEQDRLREEGGQEEEGVNGPIRGRKQKQRGASPCQGKKGGEPYKGKINKVKKDRKGKGKAPRK